MSYQHGPPPASASAVQSLEVHHVSQVSSSSSSTSGSSGSGGGYGKEKDVYRDHMLRVLWRDGVVVVVIVVVVVVVVAYGLSSFPPIISGPSGSFIRMPSMQRHLQPQ